MSSKTGKSAIQKVAYVISALVVISMILSLVGPILINPATPPTPTWPPTWTPWPTSTQLPLTQTPAVETTPSPLTATPPLTATSDTYSIWTPIPTATQVLSSSQPFDSPIPTPDENATAPESPDTPSPTVAAEDTSPDPDSTPTEETFPPLVFAVCGDSRSGNEIYTQLLDRVLQDGNMFLIHTGDLVEQGSEQDFLRFQEMMADFVLPFYPIPGNHDLDTDGSWSNFVAFTPAPAAHYSFKMGPVHFTMANSASGQLTAEELAWIDQDLADSDQSVKMVFVHHPPFDPDGTDQIMSSGNQAFMDLMQKHQVDYVFSSNIHAYSQAERNGTTYIISGGAGAPLYSDQHPDAFHHYIQVVVNGEQVSTNVIRLP